MNAAILILVAYSSAALVATSPLIFYEALAQPAEKGKPVDTPNPTPPGESLTKCPEGWTQVSRQECEKEPEYQCAQDDAAHLEGCQIMKEETPTCTGSDVLSEDQKNCINSLNGNIAPYQPICDTANGFQLTALDDGSFTCIGYDTVPADEPYCPEGELNEEGTKCVTPTIRGNR